eukprot:GHVN01065832.1.p2 GENE.GHVN01065832.1~~GHVN01065832.1.p2  ORF type:complete len:339 (-),score=58.34 GHVN01065832.1:2431-3447(-)
MKNNIGKEAFLSPASQSEPDESENSEALHNYEARLQAELGDDEDDCVSALDDLDLPTDGTDVIPKRFVDGCVGDMVEARRRWEITKRWRAVKNIDKVLEEPQRYFGFIKQNYPHSLHKMSKNGCYMYVEQPGQADFHNIWRHGVSLDDLAAHYTFVTEYIWRVLDPREDGMLFSVFDLKGVKMGALAGNVLKLFKKCAGVMQAHYPERSYKMMVINAPWWFNSAFSIVSPFIDPRTKKKIGVHGKDYLKYLSVEVDVSSIPAELNGSDSTKLGESPAEKALWKYVEVLNTKHGLPLHPTLEPLSKADEKKFLKDQKEREKKEAAEKKKASKSQKAGKK